MKLKLFLDEDIHMGLSHALRQRDLMSFTPRIWNEKGNPTANSLPLPSPPVLRESLFLRQSTGRLSIKRLLSEG